MAAPLAIPTAMKMMALVKGGLGAAQTGIGLGMAAKNKRPEFSIPESAMRSLGLARMQASQDTLPAQGEYENKIMQNAGNSLSVSRSAATNPAQILEQALKIGEGTNDSLSTLAIKGAERKDRNIQNLQGELGKMADWEKMKFDINEMQPFMQKAGVSSSLMGAGVQNMFGAADSYGASSAEFGANSQIMNMLKQLQEGAGGPQKTMSQSLLNDGEPNISMPNLGKLNNPFSSLFQ